MKSSYDRAKSFCTTKRMRDLEVTDKQFTQLVKVIDHFDEFGESKIRKQATFKKIPEMIKCGVDNAFVPRLIRSHNLGLAKTLLKFVVTFGKESGLKKWDSYRNKQAVTNTFEYKNKKYGMTKEEFKHYNRSRAVTLENLIERHGEDKGQQIWDSYVKRQAYAGSSKEYFVEKYGEDIGTRKWDELCKQKALTIENIMNRHGVDETKAIEIFCSIQSKKPVGYSKISQELFWSIYYQLSEKDREKCYFEDLNKEFGKYDHKNRSYRKYDFTLTNKKIIIEYHGDYYHANPKKNRPDDVVRIHGKDHLVRDIWELDNHKQKLVEDCGYRVIVVWDTDYRSDKEKMIERCLREINRT